MDSDFLLGGGFALLLALLGWSDQIRGVQDRTRQQEKALLDACLSNWDTLAPVLRPSANATPLLQLRAVLKLVSDGTLKSGEEALLMRAFREIDQRRAHLEDFYRVRYALVFITTFIMFLFGILEMGHTNQDEAAADLAECSAYAIFVSGFLFLLLIMTAVIAGLEEKFREQLNKIEDQLRRTAPKKSA